MIDGIGFFSTFLNIQIIWLVRVLKFGTNLALDRIH